MIKREANFGLLFRHWLKKEPMISAAFELKQTRTNSLPFSAVKEHQIDALCAAASRSGVLYKIPDDSAGIKPFDYCFLKHSLAFVVIRYPRFFCLIEVDAFLNEMERDKKRKSLSSERAKAISYKWVDLNSLKQQSSKPLKTSR